MRKHPANGFASGAGSKEIVLIGARGRKQIGQCGPVESLDGRGKSLEQFGKLHGGLPFTRKAADARSLPQAEVAASPRQRCGSTAAREVQYAEVKAQLRVLRQGSAAGRGRCADLHVRVYLLRRVRGDPAPAWALPQLWG